MTEGLIDDVQSREGVRGCVDQIFTLKQIGEKATGEKMESVCVFYGTGEGI